ncbi:MAG: BTAD domain-containing putative transcriptional regulator [Lachnospiraceae bacterium]|nr:BTAD domain-containing putative transcriptional regulator [Lachnospiraceae bacterium]
MVNIKLFDSLEFSKDGELILEGLLNTRKTKQFLAYLILNRDRTVTQKELFELLWSGQEYSNPGTALRTLLYRYRTLVTEKGISELEDSIFSKRNAYQWNNELDVSIDIFDFEAYSAVGVNEMTSPEKKEECLKLAIDLYRGTLLSEAASDHWIVKRAVKYRDMYVNDVYAYVSLLKEQNRYEEAEAVVLRAIDLVGSSDLLKAELKQVQAKGEPASDSEDYEELVSQAFEMEDEIEKIQRGMEAEDLTSSALVCNYDTFKEVYHMQRRLLARTGETMYLAVTTFGYPKDFKADTLKHENLMSLFLDTAKKSLRCGDSLCRYSDNKVALMFPTGSFEDAKKIVERVRRIYLAKISGEKMVITYRVRPLKNVNE